MSFFMFSKEYRGINPRGTPSPNLSYSPGMNDPANRESLQSNQIQPGSHQSPPPLLRGGPIQGRGAIIQGRVPGPAGLNGQPVRPLSQSQRGLVYVPQTQTNENINDPPGRAPSLARPAAHYHTTPTSPVRSIPLPGAIQPISINFEDPMASLQPQRGGKNPAGVRPHAGSATAPAPRSGVDTRSNSTIGRSRGTLPNGARGRGVSCQSPRSTESDKLADQNFDYQEFPDEATLESPSIDRKNSANPLPQPNGFPKLPLPAAPMPIALIPIPVDTSPPKTEFNWNHSFPEESQELPDGPVGKKEITSDDSLSLSQSDGTYRSDSREQSPKGRRKTSRQSEETEEETLEDFYIADDSTNILFSENGELKAANYTQLITKLTCSSPIIDIDDFLLTYRSFSNPSQLLSSLIRRFDATQEHDRRDVHLRVFNALGKWVEHYWFDFETDPQCTITATQFLNRIIKDKSEQNATDAKVAQNVKTKLDRKLQSTGRKILVQEQNCPKPAIEKDPRTITLLACEPLEIARQITLMTWETWSAIKPWECLGLAWTKGGGKAQNVEQMTKNFNYFSGWATTTLISTPTKEMRVKYCKRFLDICYHLRALGNYNGVMEIFSGLNRQPAWRMVKTFGDVMKDSKYSTLFQELKELTSHEKAYANLRAAIQNTNPPVIPYLGMYLSDLVFIEEGNPKKTGEHNLINYFKCRSIAAAIKKIQQYQQRGYALEKVEAIQTKLLRQVLVEEEADMYAISSYHEPREGKEPGPKPAALEKFEALRQSKLENITPTKSSGSLSGRPKSRTNTLKGESKMPRLSSARRSSQANFKLQKKTRDQLTPEECEIIENLCSACWAGQLGMIQTMVTHPALPNISNVPNKRGQTGLYCAARQGKTDVIIELLNTGFFDVNIQVGDHKGTALHAASFGGHADVVALLLCAGGDESLRNSSNLLARQEAKGKAIDVFGTKDSGGIAALQASFPKTTKLKITT